MKKIRGGMRGFCEIKTWKEHVADNSETSVVASRLWTDNCLLYRVFKRFARASSDSMLFTDIATAKFLYSPFEEGRNAFHIKSF